MTKSILIFTAIFLGPNLAFAGIGKGSKVEIKASATQNSAQGKVLEIETSKDEYLVQFIDGTTTRFKGSDLVELHSTPCTVCLDQVLDAELSDSASSTRNAISCDKGHRIHKECMGAQVDALPKVASLVDEGLSCCGEECQERIPFKAVEGFLIDYKKNLLDRIAKENSTEEDSPSKKMKTDESAEDQEVRILTEQIESAFNLSCPGCRSTLDEVEGCNAVTCSNSQCNKKFCNLCLKPQVNDEEAHQHVRNHSGDFWEWRDGHTGRVPRRGQGYTEVERFTVKGIDRTTHEEIEVQREIPYTYSNRYRWIIARDKLETILRTVKSLDLLEKVIKNHEPLLRKNKMFPVPKLGHIESWTQSILHESDIDKKNKIALLQNEYIYQNIVENSDKDTEVKEKASYNKQVVQTTLKGLDAPILASLDVADRVAATQDRAIQAEAGIVAVMPDDPRIRNTPAFAQIKPRDQAESRMYQIDNLILSDAAEGLMNYHQAIQYCRSCGARLPTYRDWRNILDVLSRNGGYNPNLIPNMIDLTFWSSTTDNPYFVYVFKGFHGDLDETDRLENLNSVRCVKNL